MKRVYFIKPIGFQGPVKIGCSVSPDNRRDTLETWSPFPLEVIAEIDGDFAIERRFHAYCAETHLRREWFAWSDRIAETVEAINAGTFDIETLPEPGGIAAHLFGKARKKPWYFGEQMRLSRAVTKAERRSGYKAPAYTHGAFRFHDVERIALLRAFIEQPHVFGSAEYDFWADTRAAWHSALASTDAQAVLK